jgi:hypothetical protein
MRRLITVAILCAGLVFYRAGQAQTNPSELHLTPHSLAISTVYQDAVHRCERLLFHGLRRLWCGELSYAPGFNQPPTVEQAARAGIIEFADPSHGVDANPDGPLDWQWNYVTGLWGGHAISHWWESAMALRTLARYLEVTRNTDPGFQTILMRTYRREIFNPFAIAKPYFVNDFGDDSAWWGLAWLDASKYELTVRHDTAAARKFLKLAEYDANYVTKQPKMCGGVEWKIGYPPDTITAAEYATLVAELYSYTSGPGAFHSARASRWLDNALWTMAWLERKHLINVRTGQIRDRLDPTCKQLIAGGLTYTQGQVADAFVALGSALHNAAYYQQADTFLKWALSKKSGMVNGNGILQEPCERNRDACTSQPTYLDILSWKGILMEGISDYTTATGSPEYVFFLRHQAKVITDNAIRQPDGQPGNCDAPVNCQFVYYWAWPLSPVRSGFVNESTQMDALDALTAALALPATS